MAIMPDAKVYAIRSSSGFVKIGHTRNLGARLAELQIGSPSKLELVAVGPGDRALERHLHRKYAHRWKSGEWFALSDEEVDELAVCLAGDPRTVYLPKVQPRRRYRSPRRL